MLNDIAGGDALVVGDKRSEVDPACLFQRISAKSGNARQVDEAQFFPVGQRVDRGPSR